MNNDVKNRPTPEAPKPDREAGYTLTELLVVLVIIALLTGLVAPRLIGRVGGAKSTTARTQIENLISALEIYRLDMGDYPTEEQGLKVLIDPPENTENWQGPYMRRGKIPLDPWGKAFVYKISDNSEFITILSLGKDGKEGGEGENEDISSQD